MEEVIINHGSLEFGLQKKKFPNSSDNTILAYFKALGWRYSGIFVSWLFLPEFTKDAEKQNFTNLYVSCHVLHMLNGSPNRGLSDLGVAGCGSKMFQTV